VVVATGADLLPADASAPIVGSFILDPPFAASGQCGEAVFESCRRSRSGRKLVCT
jgi:hypothetical protein